MILSGLISLVWGDCIPNPNPNPHDF
jgi:hypothetical protein